MALGQSRRCPDGPIDPSDLYDNTISEDGTGRGRPASWEEAVEFYTTYPECKPRNLDIHDAAVVARERCNSCIRYAMKTARDDNDAARQCRKECPRAAPRATPRSSSPSSSNSNVVSASDVNGVWYGDNGSTVTIKALGRGRLQLDGALLSSPSQAGSVNMGDFSGIGSIDGMQGQLTRVNDEDCTITYVFQRTPRGLTMTLDQKSQGVCGFGFRVYAVGTFTKTRPRRR